MVFPCLLNYYITALVLLFMFFHLFIYIFYCIYLFKYQLRCCKVNVTLASLLFLSENRFKLLSLSNHNVRKAIISWMLIVFFIFKYNYYIYITWCTKHLLVKRIVGSYVRSVRLRGRPQMKRIDGWCEKAWIWCSLHKPWRKFLCIWCDPWIGSGVGRERVMSYLWSGRGKPKGHVVDKTLTLIPICMTHLMCCLCWVQCSSPGVSGWEECVCMYVSMDVFILSLSQLPVFRALA